ncbi:MAG: glycerol kinase GlpK [Desulfobacterales bacterium]
MFKYIGALDLGTTSCRFIIFDKEGCIVGSSQKEHRQIFPRPGWVEHDPVEMWENTRSVMQRALGKSGVSGAEIAALGITNQRETVVVWNRHTGIPVYNAVVWQCTRTDRLCRDLTATYGLDGFREKTGLPVATYFSGPKLRWILDAIAREGKAVKTEDLLAGTIESWIIWNLTGGPDGGVHVSDVTNASRTLLMNIGTLAWDEEMLERLHIPAAILPEIVPSMDDRSWGTTRSDGPLGAEIPVCGALGDQQAALFGQTCFSPGDAKNTYGTGCFLLMNTGSRPVLSQNGLITTVAYQVRGQRPVYCLEGSIAVAGALIQWLRDNLGIISTAKEVEQVARGVDDSGDIYIVPAFSGLFAPYWRSDARGVVVGLTGYITKAHIARAALEACAYQTHDIVAAMNMDSGVSIKHLKVDGGMVENDLLMQFQSDILNVPVIRPTVTETTALGAAYAAGLAIGFWKDFDELVQNWSVDRTWSPAMKDAERRKGISGWQKAVERTYGWIDMEKQENRL